MIYNTNNILYVFLLKPIELMYIKEKENAAIFDEAPNS